MTRTVNSPCWRTMDPSQASKSSCSEVDNGDLGVILVEQRIERLLVCLLEPSLEPLELVRDGRWRALAVLSGAVPHRAPDGVQAIQDCTVRLAFAAPADLVPHSAALSRHHRILCIGRGGACRQE